MSVGRRLALPLICILLLAQVAAGVAVYYASRAAVLADAKAELAAMTERAARQLAASRSAPPVLPHGVGLAVSDRTNGWTLSAGDIDPALVAMLPAPDVTASETPRIVSLGNEQLLLQSQPLPGGGRQKAVVVAARRVPIAPGQLHVEWVFLAGALTTSIGAAIAVGLIDRTVARPHRDALRRIAQIGRGDYGRAQGQPRDKIGDGLTRALTAMSRAVADREYSIREMVLHEPITRLPNFAAFLQQIAPQLGAERAAVLVIGLVHAQEITNTVDRDVADRVLRNAAARLGQLLGDIPVACLSDRTFAAFLRNVGELRARSIAARIVSQFESPYADGKLTIDTTAAVGIALMPAHGDDGALLLRRAEIALQAGMRSETRWAVYDHAADPHRPERLSLMSDLRYGLLHDEFMLVYQPKVHLATGLATGAEALVRWHHPQRGLVPPDEFVPLAEDTGNIGHLTRWALAAGIRQAAEWRREGIDLQVAINVSARDLSDSRLPRRVAALLQENQLSPEAISLEVTESTIMTNPTAAIAVLRRLAEQNIAVSVDDFGVGRTSLAYLRTLPVRELKIDKMFVQRLAESEDDRKIVQSVVELGHNLGFAVCVEGVEDATTQAIVTELGCDYVQGFHIARPLVPEMLAKFVQSPRSTVPA
jgi:predicted signal transduction protein with EAL and GGDEF domain